MNLLWDLNVSELRHQVLQQMNLDMTARQANSSRRHCVFRENKNRVFMFYLADSSKTMMDLLGTETTRKINCH